MNWAKKKGSPAKKSNSKNNNMQRINSKRRKRLNWTKWEIAGLALSLLLIISPLLSFSAALVVPGVAGAQVAPPPPGLQNVSKGVSASSVTPGGNISFTFMFKTRANSGDQTLVTIQDNLAADMTCTGASVTTTNANIASGSSTFPVSGTMVLILEVISTVNINVQVQVDCIAPTVSNSYTNQFSADTANASNPFTTSPSVLSTIVNFTVAGVAPTATATVASTPTATATVASTPTATATVAATQTLMPANTPTNLPTGTPGVSPTATPINTPAPTPALPGQPVPAQATTPVSVTPPTGSGVVAGSVINKNGSVAGAPIDLIWVISGGEQVLASAVIDNSGQFFFGGLGSTGQGESFYLRFRNSDPSGSTLRVFNTTPFSFSSGSITRVDNIDVTDVSIGPPGASGLRITPPYTFEWFKRVQIERYSLTFFSSSSQVAFDTGDLGGATSYTLPDGKIGNGQYSAQVNVSGSQGNGVSNKRFTFAIGIIATPTPIPTTTPVPTSTVRAQSSPIVIPTVTGRAITNGMATTTASTTTVTTTTTAAVSPTTTGLPSGGSEIIGVPPTFGPTQNNTSPANTGGSGSSDTSKQLPTTGGELPIGGLVLAALTLAGRRLRLVRYAR